MRSDLNCPDVFLSLGSNLADREENLRVALRKLEEHGLQLFRFSAYYETEPVEVTDQPFFLNLVCQVQPPASAEALLEICQAVEREMGRNRKRPKGPRNIDVDILFYGNRVIRLPHLTIPHPALYRRNFVLIPLEEIAPTFQDPVSRKTVRQLGWLCTDPCSVTLHLG